MFFLFHMHSISPLEVGTKAQLFIDHRFIETSENITLKMKGPALPDEDVLTFRNPWEEGQGFVGTVIEEEGIYKFWYENQAWDAKKKRSVGLFQAVAQGNDGLLDIQLMVSRDGINWMRPDREPFIGLGLPGSGRASMIYVFPSLIRKGDELWLYYTSSDTTHGGRDRSRGFGLEPEGEENFGKRRFRRAVLPLPRFISATIAWEGGSLTTPPLLFSGSRLELNLSSSWWRGR